MSRGFTGTSASIRIWPAATRRLAGARIAFGFGWTPCIGPVLGAILTASAMQGSVSGGMWLLSAYALGLGVPFVLSAVFMRELVGRLRCCAMPGATAGRRRCCDGGDGCGDGDGKVDGVELLATRAVPGARADRMNAVQIFRVANGSLPISMQLENEMRNKLMALAPAARGLAVILFLNGGGAGLRWVLPTSMASPGAPTGRVSTFRATMASRSPGGQMVQGPGPEHDYMGFSATRERFYSSGHPAAGSGLVNPFGLIRSDDGGKTWKKLGLEGESDFHLLATGFASNAVYVFNHGANSRMKSAGLHYTLNDGLMWKPATGRGLSGEPLSLAVHPEDPKVVAVGTRDGLFLSVDSGENFRRAATGQTLAVSFDLDGTHLWSAGHDGAPTLHRMDWKGGEASAVTLPPLADDAVAYIAQNPARRDEYAIATFKRSAFVSREGGRAWSRSRARDKAWIAVTAPGEQTMRSDTRDDVSAHTPKAKAPRPGASGARCCRCGFPWPGRAPRYRPDLNPREVPSPLIGKPVPAFDFAAGQGQNARFVERGSRQGRSLAGECLRFLVWPAARSIPCSWTCRRAG